MFCNYLLIDKPSLSFPQCIIVYLEGIFPTQGSNTHLLHYRQILYHLSHQGSPIVSSGCHNKTLWYLPYHRLGGFNNRSLSSSVYQKSKVGVPECSYLGRASFSLHLAAFSLGPLTAEREPEQILWCLFFCEH